MRPFLPYLLLIPTVVAGWLGWRAEQGRRVAVQRVAQLEASRPQIGNNTPAPEASDEPGETPAASTEARVIRVPTGTDVAPYLKTIEELRDHVKDLSRDLSAAREEASRADVRTAAETAEGKKLKTQIDELREDVQTARRLSDALQTELRAKSERLVKSETSEKLMTERATRAESASSKVASASKEIEDLNRRREAYVNTILRRFREVNDLYRNFTMAAQTRDSPTPGFQAGDLSRIQSAVQQAEDDLRQLQTLNARMAQIAQLK